MNKKAWIQNDPYLDFCFNELGKQKKVVTLGCAFKKDDHILEKILLNEDLDELNIGIYNPQDKTNVCEAYKRIKDSYVNQCSCTQKLLEENVEKVSFFCTQNLGKYLWGK